MEPPTTIELLSNKEVEATAPPTLNEAELGSLHALETVGAAEDPPAADDARIADGIGSSGAAAQSQELSSGQAIINLELELFPWRGDVEAALGYGDFFEGLEELKALPLKKRRRRMKLSLIHI